MWYSLSYVPYARSVPSALGLAHQAPCALRAYSSLSLAALRRTLVKNSVGKFLG